MTDIPIVILAGGAGTRIRHLLMDLPKPMFPVMGIPFLEYQLHYLKRFGFQQFIISAGHKKEVIHNYFSKRKEVTIVDEEKALGTGGAILNVINKCNLGHFFCINGDSLFLLDFKAFGKFCKSKNMETTIALKKSTEDTSRFGTVSCDESGRIIRFNEKTTTTEHSPFINGGVYLIQSSQLKKNHFPEVCSIEKDIFPSLASQNLYGWISEAPFIDIGTPETLSEAEIFITLNNLIPTT